MEKEAMRLWTGVPPDIRRRILSNVWCGRCAVMVTIVDYRVELRDVVVLKGFCGTCGHKVARVIEGLAPAPSKAPERTKKKKTVKKPSSRSSRQDHIFTVWLYGDHPPKRSNRIIRRIRIPGTKSLYDLADVIIQAFGFDLDHCFGFYSNLKNCYDSERAYELFYDLDDVEPPPPHVGSVKYTKVRQVFRQPGDIMLFLFDYGDNWRFFVELEKVEQVKKGDPRPIILEARGEAPEQYPPWDE